MRRLVLALAVIAASVGVAPVTAEASPGFSTAYQRIPGAGGTELGAVVLTPTGQGAGPFPLVPGSTACASSSNDRRWPPMEPGSVGPRRCWSRARARRIRP